MGDPGFFSVVRNLATHAVSMIPGVGGIAGKVLSKIPTGVRGGMARVGGAIVKHPVLSAAGGAANLSARGGGGTGRMGAFGPPAGKAPSKRHLAELWLGIRPSR